VPANPVVRGVDSFTRGLAAGHLRRRRHVRRGLSATPTATRR